MEAEIAHMQRQIEEGGENALLDCQLYTPAMLAEILEVSVRTVRRWQRAGLIRPAAEVMHLPHFDFSGLATARQLANWMRQGVTVSSMQTQLAALRERIGETIPIEDLPIRAEGRRLVLRCGDQLYESNGQLRFGFESDDRTREDEPPATVQFRPEQSAAHQIPDESSAVLPVDCMIDQALAAEDDGDFESAVRWYRCALSAHGADGDICFQLAEVLYRSGDLNAARERYFMTLEIAPDIVEARANLGCVLSECGQHDLAIAAFEGALQQFSDYADVHFHLARTLDDCGEGTRAVTHWKRFLELSPSSPWAEEAEQRLASATELDF